MKAALLPFACALLVACTDAEPEDFGAQMVAAQIVLAQSKCGAAKAVDLDQCKSSTDRDARLAAKTAEAMQESYFSVCGDVIGLSKCDELLRSAYEKSRPKAAFF